jgi:hypothetical protein
LEKIPGYKAPGKGGGSSPKLGGFAATVSKAHAGATQSFVVRVLFVVGGLWAVAAALYFTSKSFRQVVSNTGKQAVTVAAAA